MIEDSRKPFFFARTAGNRKKLLKELSTFWNGHTRKVGIGAFDPIQSPTIVSSRLYLDPDKKTLLKKDTISWIA